MGPDPTWSGRLKSDLQRGRPDWSAGWRPSLLQVEDVGGQAIATSQLYKKALSQVSPMDGRSWWLQSRWSAASVGTASSAPHPIGSPDLGPVT